MKGGPEVEQRGEGMQVSGTEVIGTPRREDGDSQVDDGGAEEGVRGDRGAGVMGRRGG